MLGKIGILKNRFPKKFRGKFRGESLSAEKNIRKIGSWGKFVLIFFAENTFAADFLKKLDNLI
jgi:hypothetical protein